MGAARALRRAVPPILLAAAALVACRQEAGVPGVKAAKAPAAGVAAPDARQGQRQEMVRTQLQGRDITDEAVLAVMEQVPRHLFVPEAERARAYADHPLPIGLRQTISQPYIVAYMTQALGVEEGDRVLEIGTGSGYQAAVLSLLAAEVYTIEILPPLAERARKQLVELGYDNVQVRAGDGYFGWPERAPFDGIMVTAAPDHVPPRLVEQLAPGGRLVMPVGDRYQELVRITRGEEGTTTFERLLPVRFVPMTGRAQQGP